MKYPLPLAALTLAAIAVHAKASAPAPEGFDRYQVILARMPFGEAPPEAAPAAPPTPPAESFAKDLRICSIMEEEETGKVRVGIVDNQSKKAFVITEGEIYEEIELVSASLADEEAVLRKGAEVVRINLVSGLQSAVSPDQLAAQTAAPVSDAVLQSYRDRRQARQDLRRIRMEKEQERLKRQMEAAEMASRYTPEEIRSRLQEINMEAIRAGMPALPLELTPEQDAQLVAENILPPPEGGPPPASVLQPGAIQPSLSRELPASAPVAPPLLDQEPMQPVPPAAFRDPGRSSAAIEAELVEELNRLRLEEALKQQQALEESLETGF